MADLEELRDNLEEAVRSYMFACNDGAYLTDYVIFAAGADPATDEGTRYGFWASRSPIHTIRGLIDVGREEIVMSAVHIEPGDSAD